MRVTAGSAEPLSSPPHPSGLRPATFPPCGGKAWGPFKWGGIWSFVGRLDTYIGNWGGVRLLEGGRPHGAAPAAYSEAVPPFS